MHLSCERPHPKLPRACRHVDSVNANDDRAVRLHLDDESVIAPLTSACCCFLWICPDGPQHERLCLLLAGFAGTMPEVLLEFAHAVAMLLKNLLPG